MPCRPICTRSQWVTHYFADEHLTAGVISMDWLCLLGCGQATMAVASTLSVQPSPFLCQNGLLARGSVQCHKKWNSPHGWLVHYTDAAGEWHQITTASLLAFYFIVLKVKFLWLMTCYFLFMSCKLKWPKVFLKTRLCYILSAQEANPISYTAIASALVVMGITSAGGLIWKHLRGSAPSNRIWNNTILRSQKQQTWLRTALCGGWCWRMALCNPELHARNDDDSKALQAKTNRYGIKSFSEQ